MARDDVRQGKRRIASIDALRGVVLLGILLVHVSQFYSFAYCPADDAFGIEVSQGILGLLVDRCNKIFAILFGVSFYLVCRNPRYTVSRFAWRCTLLALIGLLVKLFYTFDVLLWFGIMGLLLCPVRRLGSRALLLVSAVLFAVSVWLSQYRLGTCLWGEYHNMRYVAGCSLADILAFSPMQACVDNIHEQLDKGVLMTLSMFTFGYFLGKSGFVERIGHGLSLSAKTLLAVVCVYAVSAFLMRNGAAWYLRPVCCFVESACISLSVLYVYARAPRLFPLFESYGRMGLTNYICQNILGVVLVSTLVVAYGLGVLHAIAMFLCIFALQAMFSHRWLQTHAYGPAEWLWRSLTYLQCITNKTKNS